MWLRAALIGLLAMATGCDGEIGWRGVGTDRRGADPAPGKPATGGEVRDAGAR